jgi:hypothetical protein
MGKVLLAALGILLYLGPALICFAKRKELSGFAGLIPPLAWIGGGAPGRP